jgi:hypothetical protein
MEMLGIHPYNSWKIGWTQLAAFSERFHLHNDLTKKILNLRRRSLSSSSDGSCAHQAYYLEHPPQAAL